MKKLFILLFVVGSMFSVIGCRSTADGVARDTERNVDAVKDSTN